MSTGFSQARGSLAILQTDSESNIEKGLMIEENQDEELIIWNGPDDPTDPFNWPTSRKITMTMVLSLGGLVTLMSTSMMAPALISISKDLQIRASETNLTLSIYVLALAFGPLLISPSSEVLGRKPVWLFCNSWYVLWNSLAPVNKSRGLLIAGRFLSGLGACVGIALPGPIMADMWRPEKRGTSFAISTFAPYLGAAIGPIIGGFITNTIGWQWLFWTVSIFTSILVLLGTIFIHESYAPVLLSRKAKLLSRDTGKNHQTKYDRTHPTFKKKLHASIIRPIQLFITRPIIPIIAIFMAYNFGVYCIALSTFADIWITRYDESTSISGLNYIAIALGSTLASQIGAPLTDRIYAYLKTKANGASAPEYRVPLMLPGAILMPLGLFWYGWSVQTHTTWLMPDIGIAIFSCGSISSNQAMVNYLVDEFDIYSASATAAAYILKNIAGFLFPIFAPQIYGRLGYGWGNSLLGFLFVGMGVPAPFLLWRYGSRLRAIGKGTS